LFQREPACGNGQHLGSNGPAATDVQGCVTYHGHLVVPQSLLQNMAASLASYGGDFVAVFAVIRKSARGERIL